MLMDTALQTEGAGVPVKLIVNHKVSKRQSLSPFHSILTSNPVPRHRHRVRRDHLPQRHQSETRSDHRSRRHRLPSTQTHRNPSRKETRRLQLPPRQRRHRRSSQTRLHRLLPKLGHRILGRTPQLEQNRPIPVQQRLPPILLLLLPTGKRRLHRTKMGRGRLRRRTTRTFSRPRPPRRAQTPGNRQRNPPLAPLGTRAVLALAQGCRVHHGRRRTSHDAGSEPRSMHGARRLRGVRSRFL